MKRAKHADNIGSRAIDVHTIDTSFGASVTTSFKKKINDSRYLEGTKVEMTLSDTSFRFFFFFGNDTKSKKTGFRGIFFLKKNKS